MQNGVAVVENSLAVFKKLNIELPYDSATPLLGIYPKELKTSILTKTCTRMFTAMLFTLTKSRQRSSYSFKETGEFLYS